MARFRYTSEMIAWLRHEAPGRSTYEIADLFEAQFKAGRDRAAIRACLKNYRIMTGAPTGSSAPKIVTSEQDLWIRQNYRSISRQELTDRFNTEFGTSLTLAQIISYTKNHKIRSGLTGQFPKGNVPWSAYQAGKGTMKPNSGSFRKGHLPHNTKFLGHERISKDGYREISIDETNPHTGFHRRYVLKHRMVWEKANGPIPDDHCLKFLDGDRLNCDLGNLALVSRSLLPRLSRRGYDTAPAEVKPLIMTTAKLETLARDRQEA